MHRRRGWRGGLLSAVLLAYPRAFRRRFGPELRADFEASGRRQHRLLPLLVSHVASGMAERWAAAVRWTWWSGHRAHVYEPAGRHAMFWDSLRSDLRFALRQAAKAPGYTALAVTALALGIGANSAVFSVVNAVLLRPLPYQASDRLAMIWSDNRDESQPLNVVSPGNFADFKARARTFESMDYSLSFLMRLTVRGEEDAPPVWALRTGAQLFEVLGRQPLLGRTYRAGDRDVAVVSHAYWLRRLGGDSAAVGRTLTLSAGETVTIVGVMPPDFAFPYRSMFGPWVSGGASTADMWIPMPFEGDRWLTSGGALIRNVHSLMVVGRLASGRTIDEARADLAGIGRQLEAEFPDSNRGWGTTVVPLLDQTVGQVRPALLIVTAGVGILLLMAAVNVANLVLARSVARQRELAVRVALGASRSRLVRQALTESLLLASAGAVTGLLLMRWGIQALVALAPLDMPRMHEVGVDLRVVLVTVAVAVLTGLLVAVLPALAAGSSEAAPALQESSRGTIDSAGRRRLRAGLVVVEIALAATLALCAGLLIRSFVQLMDVDPGFRGDAVLTLQLNVPDHLTDRDARRAFYDGLLARWASLPGVAAVGGTTRLPLGSSSVTTSLHVEGRSAAGQPPQVEFRRVLGDYFGAMGTPVVRGRLFAPEDGPTAANVAVVNQTLARRIFGGADPIGQHVRFGPVPDGPWTRIIGVVGDIRHAGLDTDPLPELYLYFASNPPNSPFIAIRATGDPAALAGAVRREARIADPALALYDVRTMNAVRSASVAERRFLLVLLSVFGGLALLLAGVGVYGVMALVVSERTQEVGVRLALGARRGTVLMLVLRQALGLTGVGVVLGVGAALVLAPLLASQLFAVETTDPLTLAAVPLVLVSVAALAAFVPARRATQIDPLQAMRHD